MYRPTSLFIKTINNYWLTFSIDVNAYSTEVPGRFSHVGLCYASFWGIHLHSRFHHYLIFTVWAHNWVIRRKKQFHTIYQEVVTGHGSKFGMEIKGRQIGFEQIMSSPLLKFGAAAGQRCLISGLWIAFRNVCQTILSSTSQLSQKDGTGA